jgi:hypothetical protein
MSLRNLNLLTVGALLLSVASNALALSGSVLTPVPNCRIADTRLGGGQLATGETRAFNVVGASPYGSQGGNPAGCGIPGFLSGVPQVTAVVVNVIATDPTGQGNLRVFPGDLLSAPNAATVNFQNFADIGHPLNIGNGSVVEVRQDVEGGDIKIFASTAAHVVIDVTGYFSDLGQQTVSGATGATGPSGPAGPSGPSGPSGPQGLAGLDGATGPSGPSGPQGIDGPTGPSGPDGATGATGPAGSGGGVFTGRILGLSSSQNRFGAPSGVSTADATLGNVTTLNSQTACTAQNLSALLTSAPGVGNTRTLSLVVNGLTSTGVTCSVTGTQMACNSSGTESIPAGATIAFQASTTSGAAGNEWLFGWECH